MTATKATSKWRKLAMAAVVFFVALELVLQVGAAVAAVTTPSRATADGAAVLCVGDSYTFGVGALSPEGSYPEQLRVQLRERGQDVAVSNGGEPSKDSAYVLRQLPRLLRPGTRVLCVMLGTNDGWSRPALVEHVDAGAAGDADEGLVLRWRTGRLLALLLRGRGTTGGAAPPAAEERVRADIVDHVAGFGLFEANGVIPREARAVVLPAPCPEALRARVDEVGQLVTQREGPRARDLARELAAQHPDSPDALRALVSAQYACADHAGCEQTLTRLEALAKSGEPAAADAFMFAAYHAGHTDQANAAARDRVAREPAALMAWHVLQHTAFMLGRREEFVQAAAAGLALAGRVVPVESGWVVRNYARMIAPAEPRKAAVLIAAGTLLDGDVALTRGTLQAIGTPLPWPDVETALVGAKVRAETTSVLHNLFAPPPDDEAWTRVLREHLLHIGRFAQARGVRVVMLSYPFARPQIEDVQRAVAGELGAPFVEVREHFERLLQTTAREDLFVADGHCNDAGYRIVAGLAAPVVARELAR